MSIHTIRDYAITAVCSMYILVNLHAYVSAKIQQMKMTRGKKHK